MPLTTGLNNLRVKGLTLLCSFRLSLTVTRMSLLLEGLSNLFVGLGVQHRDVVRGSIQREIVKRHHWE